MNEIERKWESLDISNDFLFGKVMQNPELCKELLQRILPDLDIERIEYPELQKSIKEGAESKGIRATDDDFINRLEEAVRRAKANGKRKRDYMTMEMLERVKFEEGREEGLDEGIRGAMSALKKLNIPLQNILAIIQEEYKLSLETAKKYI